MSKDIDSLLLEILYKLNYFTHVYNILNYFHKCFTTASFHRGPDLCIPNRGQAVPDSGVPAGRGAVHAAGEGGHLYGGHSLVNIQGRGSPQSPFKPYIGYLVRKNVLYRNPVTKIIARARKVYKITVA
jgi:hypothetical protein